MSSSGKVVYTCLFGGHEDLNDQPVSAGSSWDFVCFTDRSDLESQTWKIRKISTQGLDSPRESRRPKLLPHRFLGEYDHSLYIDNSMVLKRLPEEIFQSCGANDTPFCCLKHPERDCTYDEAELVIQLQMDDEERVREQMDFYQSRGLPRHAGLVAGGFLLRHHNNEQVIAHGEDWFSHVLRFSKRDQLSFQFNSRRHELSYKAIDADVFSNDLFQWPVYSNRLPYGFKPDVYLWLNPDVAWSGMEPSQHYLEYGWQENRSFRYHPVLELERLANKYRSDKGRMFYNGHFYTRVYEKYLQPLRDDILTVFEIGLLRDDIKAWTPGGPDGPFTDAPSLKMWKEYFTQAEIHGFDIQDFVGIDDERVKFTRGDQSNVNDLKRATENCSAPIKVIMDDGCHTSPHQQVSLGFLFQKLAPGGLYFIEDLRYQPPDEPQDALKTICLLKDLSLGKAITGAFMSDHDLRYIKDHFEWIKFYDSLDYNGVDLGSDSLAVIRKRADISMEFRPVDRMLTAPEYFCAQPSTPEQEAAFFTELRLANGVFKRTAEHRMDDLNEVVLSRWNATAFRPKEIMDVGASSGITTVEWLEALSRDGLEVHIVGTDMSLSADIVPLSPGAYALKTADGYVLRIFEPTSQGLPDPPPAQLLLLSPRALRYDAIEWADDDVLSPNSKQFLRRFDVIRAANILNLCYFNRDQLRCAVANLQERLAGPGARLIVNRTWEDGSNHATMFLLTEAGRFEVEMRLGQGSEIEDVVLGIRE